MAGESTVLAATANQEQLGQHIIKLEQVLQQASAQGKIISINNKPGKFNGKKEKI